MRPASPARPSLIATALLGAVLATAPVFAGDPSDPDPSAALAAAKLAAKTDAAFSATALQPALAPVAADTDEVKKSLPFFAQPVDEVVFRASPKRSSRGLRVWDVRFASPVTTGFEGNDTVHAVLYEPTREGAASATGDRPAVVILHHLENDPILEEVMAAYLARRGTVAMVMMLPFYGERRGDANPVDEIFEKPDTMVRFIKQAVLDSRRAWDVLRHWPAVDPDRVGLLGVSLGALNASIVGGVEPRIRRIAMVLGGGDLPSIVFNESSETKEARAALAKRGIGPSDLRRMWTDIEPLRYAHRMRGASVLMLNTREDEVIPRASTERLAEAIGDTAEVIWFDGDHTGMLPKVPQIFGRIRRHFDQPAPTSP